jgi:hypothetical protein
MANVVLEAAAGDTGKTARFYVIRPSDEFWWNKALAGGAGAYEAFNAANYTTAKYLTAMSETGATARYSGAFPAGIPVGAVDVVARFDTVVNTPALTDRKAGAASHFWDGASLAPIANVNVVSANAGVVVNANASQLNGSATAAAVLAGANTPVANCTTASHSLGDFIYLRLLNDGSIPAGLGVGWRVLYFGQLVTVAAFGTVAGVDNVITPDVPFTATSNEGGQPVALLTPVASGNSTVNEDETVILEEVHIG